MKNTCFFTVFLFLVLCASTAFGESVQEMLTACKPIVDQAEVSGGNIRLPTNFNAGNCWGSFSILQQVITHTYADGSRIYNVCTPPNSTRFQVIAIFVEYAQKNPQRYHEDFFDVALDALRRSFPCRKE